MFFLKKLCYPEPFAVNLYACVLNTFRDIYLNVWGQSVCFGVSLFCMCLWITASGFAFAPLAHICMLVYVCLGQVFIQADHYYKVPANSLKSVAIYNGHSGLAISSSPRCNFLGSVGDDLRPTGRRDYRLQRGIEGMPTLWLSEWTLKVSLTDWLTAHCDIPFRCEVTEKVGGRDWNVRATG